MSHRRADAGALLALTSLAVASHVSLVTGGTLLHRDLGFFFGPLRRTTFALIAAGTLPLWDPTSLSGRPLFADPNSALLNPFTWMYPLGGIEAIVVATALAIATTAFVLLRCGGLTPLPAFFGAAMLAVSGPVRSSEAFLPMLSYAVFLPLAMFAFHRLQLPSESSAPGRRMAFAAGAMALLLVGGEPAVAVQGLALLAGITAFALFDPMRSECRWRMLARSLAAAGLGLALATLQLAPAIRALLRSDRAGGLDAAHGPLYWSMPPLRLLATLLPNLYGDPSAERAEDFWGALAFDGGGPYLASVALGVAILPLLAAALTRRSGRWASAGALGAAILALGRFTPIGPAFVAWLPGASALRYPEKWMLSAAILAVGAAAVGFAALDDARARRAAMATGLVLTAAFVAAGLWAQTAPAAAGQWLETALRVAAPDARHAVEALSTQAFGQAAVALAIVGTISLFRQAVAPPLLAAVAILELFTATAPLIHASEAPVPDAVAARVIDLGGPLYYEPEWSGADVMAAAMAAGGWDCLLPAHGAEHGLAYVGNLDVDRLAPRHAARWAAETRRLEWGRQKLERLRAAGTRTLLTLRPLDGLPGIEPIAASGARRAYKFSETRPHAHVAPRAFVVASPDASAEDRPDFHALETTVLLRPDRPPSEIIRAPGRVVTSTIHSPLAEEHEVDVPSGGFFVLARTFDPDFRATVDGVPTPTELADGMFTALELAPGRHHVAFKYRNPTLLPAALISLAALALTIWLIVFAPKETP